MITFDSDTHTYRSDAGEQYTSVTQLISAKYPFVPSIAVKRAIQSSKSRYYKWGEQEVLNEWKRIAEEGTKFHNVCQEAREGKAVETIYHRALQQFLSLPWSQDMQMEQMVWSHDWKIAGTIDIIERKGSSLVLYDIKTSEKMQPQKLQKYTLQLCLYRLLAEEVYQCPVEVGGILWFPDLANNFETTLQYIKVKDLFRLGKLSVESLLTKQQVLC